MNSRSSHILILWKFNMEVETFTSPGSIQKKLQGLATEVCSLHLQVLDKWSPFDTKVSYKSWSNVIEICTLWSWIRAASKRSWIHIFLQKMKWNMNRQPSPKNEVITKFHKNPHRSSHPSSREVQDEVTRNLVAGVPSICSLWEVMRWKNLCWPVTGQMLEVEVTPLGHWKSSQMVMLQHEVAHADLFLHTEVVSYLDIQKVIIKIRFQKCIVPAPILS